MKLKRYYRDDEAKNKNEESEEDEENKASYH